MQLGLIGLGKMGGNMAERLRLGGHQVVGFDFSLLKQYRGLRRRETWARRRSNTWPRI